ncbi:hypothetical protein Tcan_12112 [Toxocara canis]|uniref:Uncharacterized protein n=1 Tax=Toxocara canis TaxID=6265 RepID=A0A0B2V482_TOXCA|nr:hypothetical protein Tcan_12112 [Toxocara canis]
MMGRCRSVSASVAIAACRPRCQHSRRAKSEALALRFSIYCFMIALQRACGQNSCFNPLCTYEEASPLLNSLHVSSPLKGAGMIRLTVGLLVSHQPNRTSGPAPLYLSLK